MNNSKIITWICNSVEPSIGFQLAKFKTAKETWEYLSSVYLQSNSARAYQLGLQIRAAKQANSQFFGSDGAFSSCCYSRTLIH